jgi:uncharacterized protein YgiM (DUF1202 family)
MKMHLPVRLFFFLLNVVLVLSQPASAQERGVINDPDGFVNLRSGKSTSADVIAKVKDGQVFKIEQGDDADWAKVTLRSGQSGWMHRSRIRLYFTEDDLAKKSDVPEGETELTAFGRSRGVDYYAVVRRALRGNQESLKRFFGFADDVDGGAAEGYYSDLAVVAHLLGDDKLSRFLEAQTKKFRTKAAESLNTAWELTGIADKTYFQHHFPKSSRLLN